MTALNNDIRTKLVAKIMADLPVMVDPREGLREKAREAAIARLPAEVRAVWNSEKTRGYLETGYFSIGTVSIDNVPHHVSDGYYRDGFLDRVFGAELVAEIKQACCDVQEARNTRDALSVTLLADFKAVRTFDAFRQAYPEFAKYLPEEVAGKPGAIVRSDAVERVKAMGWSEG